MAALRKARNSFSVKADFWGVNCRAAARGVLFARKKASLAIPPDAACDEGCHAARGGAWGCRLRRRAGLLLAQAFATLRVAGVIALRRDRDAVSLSCSCKKVTKEARQRGRRSHAAAPFGIPFWLLVQFVILLRRWQLCITRVGLPNKARFAPTLYNQVLLKHFGGKPSAPIQRAV